MRNPLPASDNPAAWAAPLTVMVPEALIDTFDALVGSWSPVQFSALVHSVLLPPPPSQHSA